MRKRSEQLLIKIYRLRSRSSFRRRGSANGISYRVPCNAENCKNCENKLQTRLQEKQIKDKLCSPNLYSNKASNNNERGDENFGTEIMIMHKIISIVEGRKVKAFLHESSFRPCSFKDSTYRMESHIHHIFMDRYCSHCVCDSRPYFSRLHR